MLEIHLAGGGEKQTYPNSGPGTKILNFGTEDIGYFGEVTGAELFTASQFIDQTGAWFGTRETTPTTMNELWLKFFFKGKVIYIAKYPFINNIGWNDVYNAGLMYGTQDNGKYPIAAAPVYQFNPLFKNDGRDWVLVPRNIKGLNADPFSSHTTAADWSGSEWTELLGRVAAVTNTPVDDKWANFTVAQLGLDGRYTIGQETSAPGPTKAVFMGVGYPVRGVVAKTQQNLGYRPVLELVDTAAVLVPPLPVVIDPEGLAQIEVWEGKVDPAIIVQRPDDIRIVDFTSKFLLPTYSIDASSVLAPVNVTANDDTPTWSGFTINGTYTD